MRVTGEIERDARRIGDRLVHENGRLTALDDPEVKAIAAKYPGHPGLDPEPYQG